jgi:hypothetical protein
MWSLALASTLCFNFQAGEVKPLAEPIAARQNMPVTSRGKTGSTDWGAAREIIPKKPVEVYKWLLDHHNWKDTEKTKLKIVEEKRKGLAAFHKMDLTVRVVAFITISWSEEWAYKILDGTPENPKHFQVAYQKTAGTGHIRSLCGFVEGKSSGEGTDLYFYEQADASHYDNERIEKMHLDFLDRLSRPVKPSR